MEKKYYFYSNAVYYNNGSPMAIESDVTSKHPFEEIAELNAFTESYEATIVKVRVLINYKEITKEEHDLYIKLDLL